MKKVLKEEKGITLIALIITIIVMIILAAVTINVALNGGIFDRATDAKQKTAREVEREQIIAAMVGAYDSNGNFVKPTILPEGMKWGTKDETYETATETGNYVITENNEKFYVDPDNGTVLDEESESEVDDLVPTETEKSLVQGDSNDNVTFWDFADNKIMYNEWIDGDLTYKWVTMLGDSARYVWLCDEQTANKPEVYGMFGLSSAKPNIWYQANASGISEYTAGTSPIIKDNYTSYVDSYLTRIINSFL